MTKFKNEWDDNMEALELLSRDLDKIKFTKRIHPGLVADSKTTNLPDARDNPEALYDWMMREFGHCVMGKWQFLYERDGKKISCIRGGASSGDYEIYGRIGGIRMKDPERFENAVDTLARIKELLV